MRQASIAACMVVLILAFTAPGARALDRPSGVSVDEIPGVELPASGNVSGTVDASATADNVYWLYLERGSTASFHLSADAGALAELFFFAPDANSVSTSPYLIHNSTHVYPTTDSYWIASSGYYFVDVFALHGATPYSLPYTIAGAPNDRIPGVRATSRPVVDFLDGRWDTDDVTSIALRAGDRLSLHLGVDPGQRFSDDFAPALRVFSPASAVVATASAVGAGGDAAFTAPVAGTYFVDAYTQSGSGGTALSWSVSPTRPSVSRTPSSSRLSYKRRARFTLGARVVDQYGFAMPGRSVYLLQSSNGGRTWRTRVKTKTNSGGSVAVKFTARTKSTTYFRWYVPTATGSKSAYSSSQRVVIR